MLKFRMCCIVGRFQKLYNIVQNLDNQHTSNRYAVHKDQHLAPSALQCLMFGAVRRRQGRVQRPSFKVIGAENNSHGPMFSVRLVNSD